MCLSWTEGTSRNPKVGPRGTPGSGGRHVPSGAGPIAGSMKGALDRLSTLLEDLVHEEDASRREGQILQALVQGNLAEAAASWHKVQGQWSCLGTEGPTGGLPTREQVEAVAAGELDGAIPPHGRVLTVPGTESALALCGTDIDEETTDILEAVLVLHHSLLETQDGKAPGVLDMLRAPFGNNSGGAPHLPSAETASLFALLEEAREEDEVDPDER